MNNGAKTMQSEGPWKVEEYEVRGLTVIGNNTEEVAYVPSTSTDDANLISAAPDLLKALELVLPLAKGYVRDNNVGSNSAYIKFAESILAKLG